MASAKPDPTVPEVLTRDQIKTLSREGLIRILGRTLRSCNNDHYKDTENLNRDIEIIYDKEEVPNGVPLDEKTKKEIKDLIEKTIEKVDEDLKEALASLEQFKYRAITINMLGSKAKGVTSHRRDMINIILRNFVPGVVFCQEHPGRFEEEVAETLNTEPHWDYVWTGKEAGVMWNTKFFTGETREFRSTDRRMIQIREKLADPFAENLLSRACFVKLTSVEVQEESPRSFIAVSYHGEKNTKKEEARIKIFRSLIEFVRQLCEEEMIPFLIGGDFNFDTLCEDVLPKNIVSATYEMTSRTSDSRKIPYKDNFIWEWKKPINMTHIRPFVFGSGADCDLSRHERDNVEQLPEEVDPGVEADDILDHDPIIGILELQEPIIGKLEEKFGKLDTSE